MPFLRIQRAILLTTPAGYSIPSALAVNFNWTRASPFNDQTITPRFHSGRRFNRIPSPRLSGVIRLTPDVSPSTRRPSCESYCDVGRVSTKLEFDTFFGPTARSSRALGMCPPNSKLITSSYACGEQTESSLTLTPHRASTREEVSRRQQGEEQ
jgi:hypothetical protein